MIKEQQVLQLMENYIQQALQAHSEQVVREQVSAIRALCDVVLLNESMTNKPVTSSVEPIVQPSLSSSSSVLEETKSDSIFDF